MMVHRRLRPGPPAGVHETYLSREPAHSRLRFARQMRAPVVCLDRQIAAGFRADLLAGSCALAELKSVDLFLQPFTKHGPLPIRA